MALAAKIRATVAANMPKLDDLRSDVVLQKIVPGNYDPATGTTTDVTTTAAFKAPVVRAEDKEMADIGGGAAHTEVVLCTYDMLAGYTVDVNDEITIDGVRWSIVKIKKVPGAILTKLFVQAP